MIPALSLVLIFRPRTTVWLWLVPGSPPAPALRLVLTFKPHTTVWLWFSVPGPEPALTLVLTLRPRTTVWLWLIPPVPPGPLGAGAGVGSSQTLPALTFV